MKNKDSYFNGLYLYHDILFPNPPKLTTCIHVFSGGMGASRVDSLLNLRYCSGLASVVFRRPSSIVSRP